MREIEMKLLSELMKNSRRSDRDLAKAIGTSQPTVTRIRRKLEKQGIIKEYTVFPDFNKLGYELLVFTFVKLRKALSPEEVEKARKSAIKELKTKVLEVVMCERGIGMGYHGVFISFHENYAAYLKFIDWLRGHSFIDISGIDSFIISLADEVHYRSLTFSTLAKHLLTLKTRKASV